MGLLTFFLLSYYPFKRRAGSVMVFFMLGYGIHRFLNEMLRTDNDPVALGMTLSQNISLIVIAAGVVLGLIVWKKGPSMPAPASLSSGDSSGIAFPGVTGA
jgi:prolipoprotein diacylglyceryltransferase